MKVLGINGSHRAGKGTAALLQAALDGAAEQGMALRVPVGGGVVATGFAGLDEAGRPQWRPVKADEIGFLLARQLGREAVSLAVRLG